MGVRDGLGKLRVWLSAGLVLALLVVLLPGQTRAQERDEVVAEPSRFSDVPVGHVFETEVGWLASTEITLGRGDGSFGVGDPVTRGAMAAFLFRYDGEAEGPFDAPEFGDVPAGHVFEQEIAWLASTGITQGRGDGTFGVGDVVTRGAMAAFLYRFAWEPVPLETVGAFADVAQDHVFAQPVGWLAATGVTVGRGDGTFGLNDPLTRGQMAALLFRFDRWMTTGGLPVLDPSRGSPPVFDAGAGVTVASHDLSGAVTARLVGDDPGFQGLPPATAVFELSVDGLLDGVAEVRLPLSVPLAEDEVVIGLHADGAGADFEPMPVRVEDGEVVITTDSFSWFAGVRARTGDVIDTARREVIDPWTADVFVDAEHPECRDEDRAREDGYEVFSVDGPTVFWCFGRAGDSRVLRVTNNRRYALVLSFSGATVLETPESAKGLMALSGLLRDDQVVLPRGATVGFDATITDQPSIVIDTRFDGLASSMFQLQVGLETAYELLTRFGTAPARTGVEALDEAVKDIKCRTLLLEIAAGDPPPVGGVLPGCLSPTQLYKLFGTGGLLLGPLLLTGQLISFFDVQARSLIDIASSRDHYRIVILRSTPDDPSDPNEPPSDSASPLRFRELSAGAGHTCGITDTDDLYCWGDGLRGQLGVGDRESRLRPTRVVVGSQGFTPGSVRSVSAGYRHTCAITNEGELYCWGDGATGVLGNGSFLHEAEDRYQSSPVRVLAGAEGFTPDSVREVTAGSNLTCAITSAGSAYCWGANHLGDGWEGEIDRERNSRPVRVAAGEEGFTPDAVATISTWSVATCAITASGGVYCWGSASFGTLGTGRVGSVSYPDIRSTPARVVAGFEGFTPEAVRDVSVGGTACAITLQDELYCWGDGDGGRLGTGMAGDEGSPVRVAPGDEGFTPGSVSAISSGLTPCAVTETGRLYCWGYGTAGEVGDGGTEDRLAPTRVSAGTMGFDPARVRQVVGIAGHSCALTEDSRAFCWGRNSRGQLGVGTATPYEPTPVLVGPASPEG